MPRPVISDATGISILGPYLSRSGPRKKLDRPPARARQVVAHPNMLLEIPRSVHMGSIKRPRFNVPAACVAKLIIKRVVTIIHP